MELNEFNCNECPMLADLAPLAALTALRSLSCHRRSRAATDHSPNGAAFQLRVVTSKRQLL